MNAKLVTTMTIANVDEYIAASAQAVQAVSKDLRSIIKKVAPEAQEKLSYGMPYYSYKGRLIYWGAYKDYVGLYVMTDARLALADEIEPYRTAKATLHFAVDKPLPKELIARIVQAQMAANEARHAAADK